MAATPEHLVQLAAHEEDIAARLATHEENIAARLADHVSGGIASVTSAIQTTFTPMSAILQQLLSLLLAIQATQSTGTGPFLPPPPLPIPSSTPAPFPFTPLPSCFKLRKIDVLDGKNVDAIQPWYRATVATLKLGGMDPETPAAVGYVVQFLSPHVRLV